MKKILFAAALAAMLAGCREKPVQYNTQAIVSDTVYRVVTATGYLQPVDKVDVGTQVSGVIEKIFVDFNSEVKKGQRLAELDKLTLNERVVQAQATLTSALSELTYAQQGYDRTKRLFEAKAATQVAWEQAVNALSQATTSVANARANLHQAKVNLSYADIFSPIDGVVLNRAVDQGQTVAASFNTPTLFTIAKDLKRMQVEADIDEADIGQVALGQPVTFTVDSYPDDTFTGTVSQIRLQPTVTSNVVTYTVIIDAPNPDQRLFPGMTASVSITTSAEVGLTVPAEALRFSPEDSQKKGGVWIKTDSGIEQRDVKQGVSDGVKVVVAGDIAQGDTVVLSVRQVHEVKKEVANPLVPKRKGRK